MTMRLKRLGEGPLPDPDKLGVYARAPEMGPRLLFFSGGSALRQTSRELIRYTHNSIHLITPFDSGGSSAVIRETFDMLAVGDIRNRLMALADQSVKGNPAIFELFTYRLPKESGQMALDEELSSMAIGDHPLVRVIPDPMRTIICTEFEQFLEFMPVDFDLRGASIGNIVLTAGYLSNRRRLAPVISVFSQLSRVCGVVRPTVDQNLHLAARLENGQVVVGQHNLTGKEADPITSPIKDIWMSDSLASDARAEATISAAIKDYIQGADLICYPIGSFYSSVIANLLPQGVGAAVAHNECPKVFVPNTVTDPEAIGMSVADQAAVLRTHLLASGAPEDGTVLEAVILDTENGQYPDGIDMDGLRAQGVAVIDCRLSASADDPLVDGRRLSEVLLSLM